MAGQLPSVEPDAAAAAYQRAQAAMQDEAERRRTAEPSTNTARPHPAGVTS
ncbi:hypothetical protein [Streptomyces sp. NPDC086838]|jgi:hypothetical protein|uniref:hypothetical protein n=1 Tax=Streptomyces sp. NPDC086838 TaxID=3365762 RepID=UPI00382C0B4A